METTIRASSLPAAADCMRRWASRQLSAEIGEAGYRVRTIASSIGAAVGSGTHASVSHDLAHKMDHGELCSWSETEQRGIAELEERIEKEGVQYDKVTPDLSDAQLQVRRLARMYRDKVAPTVKPLAVERRLKARYSPTIILSGQQDLVVAEPFGLRDLKTGKRRGSNHAQMGAYAKLLAVHGQPVATIEETFIQRVPLRKDQPLPIPVHYDVETCETQAEVTLHRLATAIDVWRRSGDPEAFPANPSSGLCSSRFCPAHGSKWCRLGKSE